MGAPFVENSNSAALHAAQGYFENSSFENFLNTLNQGGLDIVHLGGSSNYQAQVDLAHRLPDFGRDNALAILIGNSRAMWPPFVHAYESQKTLQKSTHPLNHYTFEIVERAAQWLGKKQVRRYVFDAPPKQIAFQKLCASMGLAAMSDAHLNIHRYFGPWFALRAVIIFDKSWIEASQKKVEESHPCAPCSAHCRRAFKTAMTQPHQTQAWIELRRQCSVGQEQAYGPMQMRYHYFKDRLAIQLESPKP